MNSLSMNLYERNILSDLIWVFGNSILKSFNSALFLFALIFKESALISIPDFSLKDNSFLRLPAIYMTVINKRK